MKRCAKAVNLKRFVKEETVLQIISNGLHVSIDAFLHCFYCNMYTSLTHLLWHTLVIYSDKSTFSASFSAFGHICSFCNNHCGPCHHKQSFICCRTVVPRVTTSTGFSFVEMYLNLILGWPLIYFSRLLTNTDSL